MLFVIGRDRDLQSTAGDHMPDETTRHGSAVPCAGRGTVFLLLAPVEVAKSLVDGQAVGHDQ